MFDLYDKPIPVPAVPTESTPNTDPNQANTAELENKRDSLPDVGAPVSSPTLPDSTAQSPEANATPTESTAQDTSQLAQSDEPDKPSAPPAPDNASLPPAVSPQPTNETSQSK